MTNEFEELKKSLSLTEIEFIQKAIPFIDIENGTFLLNYNALLEKFQGLEPDIHFSMSLLFRKNCIYIGENSEGKQYFINPLLFINENEVSPVLKTFFSSYKIKIHGNKRWGDMQEILTADSTSFPDKNK